MLQDIREKSKGWISWMIVGLIAFTFVLVGTGSFFSAQDKQILAKVNGYEVSKREVDNYYERYIQQQGDKARGLDPQAVKAYALDTIIKDKALMGAVDKRGFRVSKPFLIQEINHNPSFQQDGQFSVDRYRNLLSQSYFTDQEYRAYLSYQFIVSQLQQGLVSTNFILEDELKTVFKFMDQKRDFDYLVVKASDFVKDVKITDADAQSYYDENPELFKSREEVKAAFLELKIDDVKGDVEYTDEILNQHYLDNIQVFTDPDKFKVAHILVAIDSSSEQGEANALVKIREIKDKIKKEEDFAKLAKEFSDDPVSAEKGGELFWVSRGDNTLVAEFEAAVYDLKKVGQISEPVKTSFGFHIIKLLDKKDAHVESFKEAKEKVKDFYLSQKAEEIILDKADQLVSLAYEYSDNLDKAADELELEIKTTDYFGRNGGDDLVTQQKGFLNAAFSEEVLIDKHNSELIEIEQNHYVVLRILDHKTPELKNFDVVKSDIITALTNQKASELAKAKANAIAMSLKEKPFAEVVKDSGKWEQATGVSRMDNAIDLPIMMKAFEIPKLDEKLGLGTTPLIGGNFAVIAIKNIINGSVDDVDDERLEIMRDSLSQNLGTLDFQLIANELRSKMKVTKTEE